MADEKSRKNASKLPVFDASVFCLFPPAETTRFRRLGFVPILKTESEIPNPVLMASETGSWWHRCTVEKAGVKNQ
jgi:hypothetical protein